MKGLTTFFIYAIVDTVRQKTNPRESTIMQVNEYKELHNLTDRQWRTLKTTVETANPNTPIVTRTGSKTFDITKEAKPLLDALLPTKTNAKDNTQTIEVLTAELVEYDYSTPQNDNAIVYGNSNVKDNHFNITRLNDTLSLTDELFNRIDNAIDIHKSNLLAQVNAITTVNDELELKLTEVREKLLQIKKAELKAKTRIETGTDEAAKKHLELSALLSQFSSHLG